MVKNLPCNAGDLGSVPYKGTGIPHATCKTATTEPASQDPTQPNKK